MKHILGMMTSEEKHLMASHSAMEFLEHCTFIKDHERNSVIEWSLNDTASMLNQKPLLQFAEAYHF